MMKNKREGVKKHMNKQPSEPHSLKIMLSTELVLDLFLCRYYSEKELNKILSWLKEKAEESSIQLYISKTCIEKIHLYLGCLNPQAAENALIFLEQELDIQVFDIDLDVRSIQFNLKFPCVDYLFEIKGAQKIGINLVVTLRPDLYFESGIRVTSTGLVLTNLYNTEELIHCVSSFSEKDRLRQPLTENSLLGDALRNANADFIPNHRRRTDAAIHKSDIFLDSEALSELFLNIYLDHESRSSLLAMLQKRPGNICVSRFGIEKLNFYILKQHEQVSKEASSFLSSPKVKILKASEGAIQNALKERHGNSMGLSLEAAIASSNGIKFVVTFRRNTYDKYRLKSFYLEEFAALLRTRSLELSSKKTADSQKRKDAIHFLYEFCMTEDKNFRYMNLSGQDFSNLDLRGSDFSGAILHRANLSQANLENANFTGADLSLADLARTNLKGANLTNAYMEFSNLSYANLCTASLQKACLNLAKLDHAEVLSANLTQAQLAKSSLKGAVFNNSDLSFSDINQSNIEGATFYQAKLVNANLTSCNLKGTALRKADLSGANLEKANLIRTDLTYSTLQEASLRGAKINNSTMKAAVLKGADFRPLIAENKEIITELICVSMFKTDLSHANLSGVIARRTNFNNSKLVGATIHRAKLLNTSFLDAVLDDANLESSDFGGAIFTEASLVKTNLEGAKLEGAYLDRAILDGVCLKRAELDRAFFGKASMRGADLSYCTARNANFKEADLTMAFLERAQLFNANFERASLTKADLNNALLEGANLLEADLCHADLSSASLRGVILKRAILVEALLVGTQMQGSYLKDTNLTRADLRFASLNYSRFKRAVLSHAKLQKARLLGADLRFAQLDHANLRETSLEEANISCAVFFSADLTLADLRNANVASAIFVEADLSGANLAGADLSDTDLTRAKLGKTDLSRAKLMASNLSGSDLSFANLRLACLSDANLSNTKLNAAQLIRTNLNGVNARGANLSAARIEECTTLGTYVDIDKVDSQRTGENNTSCSYQDRLLDAEEAVERLNDAVKKLKNVKLGFDEKLDISKDFVDVAVYLSEQIKLAEVDFRVSREILESIGIVAQARDDLNTLNLFDFSREINTFILQVSKSKREIMKICTKPRSFYSLKAHHGSTPPEKGITEMANKP